MVQQEKYSSESDCLHFGIASSGIISQWVQAFEKQGINGLIPKSKGHPSMNLQYPQMPPKPRIREDALELENLKLRAENVILKKLQALNQQRMQKKPKS